MKTVLTNDTWAVLALAHARSPGHVGGRRAVLSAAGSRLAALVTLVVVSAAACGGSEDMACQIGPDDTISATLRITADDNYKLYVDGALIDDTPRLWSDPQTYTVKLYRHPTHKNVIAVEGINTQKISGLDRGVIVDIAFTLGGSTRAVLTDASWKLSTRLAADWFAPSFNDAAWSAPTVEGPHGIAPWGPVLGTSSAQWLWSYSSDLSVDQKPVDETVYLRKTFYLSTAGAPLDAPGTCP